MPWDSVSSGSQSFNTPCTLVLSDLFPRKPQTISHLLPPPGNTLLKSQTLFLCLSPSHFPPTPCLVYNQDMVLQGLAKAQTWLAGLLHIALHSWQRGLLHGPLCLGLWHDGLSSSGISIQKMESTLNTITLFSSRCFSPCIPPRTPLLDLGAIKW